MDAQGLMAGVNAAAKVAGNAALRLDRAEAYIGVMIDDLVTLGTTEPYRMFTSRAEYRLRLRADNADQRLTEKGLAAGCVGAERGRRLAEKMKALESTGRRLDGLIASPSELKSEGININQDGVKRSARASLA